MRSERKPELGPELSRGGGAGAARWAFAWGGFALVAFLIYWPALEGPFVSDDLHYVANNPYVRELSWPSVYETISPRGEVVRLVENYAPVHVLLHGIEWQLFEADVRGYHVVNVVLHVVAAVLLLRLLRRSGLSDAAALFGAAFFLVHPANVEAVAWISQLKTSSSLVLALAALLALPSRPLLATACFALAILAKPVAAFALSVFAILAWTQARGRDSEPVAPLTSGRWLAAWAIVFAAFTLVEFDAFLRATSPERAEGYELASRLPMAVALWGR